MGRPHLLYTAWSFPPSRAGGVYRALATVNAFAAAGWDVTVLTVPRSVWVESTGADADLEERVAPGVEIIRVPTDVPAFQNDIALWPRGRGRHPELWKLQDLRRDMVLFPEPNYGRWRPALERAAEQVHAAEQVDLAVGTANPHVDFIPGWHLHRRFGVRYVMDYRDAWQLDVFSGERLITAIPPVRWWERRLMADAAEIWFVNDAIRQWHVTEHPSEAAKMRVVANGYEEYGAPLAVPVRAERDRGLVFGYIGTVSDKVPMIPLLEAWRLARVSEPALEGARMRIHGYLGHFGAANTALAAALEAAKADGVEYVGPVEKPRSARRIAVSTRSFWRSAQGGTSRAARSMSTLRPGSRSCQSTTQEMPRRMSSASPRHGLQPLRWSPSTSRRPSSPRRCRRASRRRTSAPRHRNGLASMSATVNSRRGSKSSRPSSSDQSSRTPAER